MFGLEFTETVNNDIVSALRYINDVLDAPKAAERHYELLLEKYELIKNNPYSMQLVRDEYLASKGIRAYIIKNYLLFYKIIEEKNIVLITRFLFGRMDWINILTNDENEKKL